MPLASKHILNGKAMLWMRFFRWFRSVAPLKIECRPFRKEAQRNLMLIRIGTVGLAWLSAVTISAHFAVASVTEPVNPLMREFTIKVNPTALTPPTWWQVPGVTPLIWLMDPISTDAYRTTEPREIHLKPGEYRFGTYTFNFAFHVTLAGTLDYAQALDQCVKGRDTRELTILCSHTQPYPQEPDYYESGN